MTERKRTGNRGERLAEDLLRQKGHAIERRNYRHRRTEVDLISRLDDVLVFTEVKTRTDDRFGHPSQFYTPAQKQRISQAAAAYAREVEHDWEIRFDLVAVLIENDRVTIDHYEDVFFPGLH
jgi:putative endonuclease